MAPITNITTAIIDAVNQARAATDPSSPVNLNLTYNNQVQSTSSSGFFSNPLINSIVTFFAALANIWLGLGGVIGLILFFVQRYKKGTWMQWPLSAQEEQVELTREHLKLIKEQVELSREHLEATKRMEDGQIDVNLNTKEHHDLLGRQMDLLLKHFDIKGRPCIHSAWESHRADCPPQVQQRDSRYPSWDEEEGGIDWSVFGSRDNLIPFDGSSQQQTEPTDLGSEKGLHVVDVPSDWIRVSESVVENQSVADWGSHEKIIWLGDAEEGLAGLPLYHGTTKLKAS
ncbi:hypothetical protein GE21DRAFT_1308824 [Neurospora crassa]|nr:hypothetical protein GE21DRAFT_1308824 [Neurospora crassa]